MEGEENLDERIILKLFVSGTCLIRILTITITNFRGFTHTQQENYRIVYQTKPDCYLSRLFLVIIHYSP